VSISVTVAREATVELLDGVNRLLPQLSTSASALTIDQLRDIVSSPGTYLFIARNGDVIVGSLTLVTFVIPTGRRAWIEDVVVDETARGLGIGRALTQAAIDTSTEIGVRSIDLTSRPSREAANALYVKMGFVARDTNVYRFSID